MRIIACIEDPTVIEKISHPPRCESPEAGRIAAPAPPGATPAGAIGLTGFPNGDLESAMPAARPR